MLTIMLSGRTVEFVFDQTQTAIIGSKYWDIPTTARLGVADSQTTTTTTTTTSAAPTSSSGTGSGSRTTTTTSSDNVSTWKRPASSQVSL